MVLRKNSRGRNCQPRRPRIARFFYHRRLITKTRSARRSRRSFLSKDFVCLRVLRVFVMSRRPGVCSVRGVRTVAAIPPSACSRALRLDSSFLKSISRSRTRCSQLVPRRRVWAWWTLRPRRRGGGRRRRFCRRGRAARRRRVAEGVASHAARRLRGAGARRARAGGAGAACAPRRRRGVCDRRGRSPIGRGADRVRRFAERRRRWHTAGRVLRAGRAGGLDQAGRADGGTVTGRPARHRRRLARTVASSTTGAPAAGCACPSSSTGRPLSQSRRAGQRARAGASRDDARRHGQERRARRGHRARTLVVRMGRRRAAVRPPRDRARASAAGARSRPPS